MSNDRARIWGTVPAWITAGVMITGLVLGVLNLPTKDLISQIGNEIADRSMNKIESIAQETADHAVGQVGATIVSYRTNPGGARDAFYLGGLNAALAREYITSEYITSEQWRGNDKLITEDEMRVINEVFASIKTSGVNPDLFSVMELVLTRLIQGGKISYEATTVSKGKIRLTPHEKIGVIGGYINDRARELGISLKAVSNE